MGGGPIRWLGGRQLLSTQWRMGRGQDQLECGEASAWHEFVAKVEGYVVCLYTILHCERYEPRRVFFCWWYRMN